MSEITQLSTVGMYMTVAAAKLATTSSDVIPFALHMAFLSSIGDSHPETAAVKTIVSGVLAYSSNVNVPLWILAFIRSLLNMRDARMVKQTEYTRIPFIISCPTTYTFATWMYGVVLLFDAATCCGTNDVVSFTTRSLHVAAVCASLIHIIPYAVYRYDALRIPLLVFPMFDILLSLYRIYCNEIPYSLVARVIGASTMCVAIACSKFACHESRLTDRKLSCESTILNRASVTLYILLHIVHTHLIGSIDHIVSILFHHIVIVTSFVWIALEHADRMGHDLGVVFVGFECASSLLLCFRTMDIWTMANAGGCVRIQLLTPIRML